MAWPMHYRASEADRLETVRRLGLRAIPSLTYAHRPGMARWLNDWCTEFAARVPDAVHSGTFFPEPSAATGRPRRTRPPARGCSRCTSRSGCSPRRPAARRGVGRARGRRVRRSSSTPAPRRGPASTPGPAPVGRAAPPAPGPRSRGRPPRDDRVPRVRRPRRGATRASTSTRRWPAPTSPNSSRRCPTATSRGSPSCAAKVVLGSDFPNIPYAYAHQLEALDRLEPRRRLAASGAVGERGSAATGRVPASGSRRHSRGVMTEKGPILSAST